MPIVALLQADSLILADLWVVWTEGKLLSIAYQEDKSNEGHYQINFD